MNLYPLSNITTIFGLLAVVAALLLVFFVKAIMTPLESSTKNNQKKTYHILLANLTKKQKFRLVISVLIIILLFIGIIGYFSCQHVNKSNFTMDNKVSNCDILQQEKDSLINLRKINHRELSYHRTDTLIADSISLGIKILDTEQKIKYQCK